MAFNTFSFVLFLTVALFFYWSVSQKHRILIIIISSIGFYSAFRIEYSLLIIATAAIGYWGALFLAESKRPRTLVIGLIAFHVGVLGYFKYAAFLIATAKDGASLLGFSIDVGEWAVFLPLGISFFVFQQISYLVDVYRRDVAPARSVSHYAAYLMFFPQLIAGPIVRGREMLPQLSAEKSLDWERLIAGVRLVLMGLILKSALADGLAPYVDAGFTNAPESLSATDVWALTTLFGLQIYFDFAAYSMIAIGAAACFGLHLPKNFDFPYFARSPRQFWQRWHITLSSWVRDYVYLPLRGRRPEARSIGGFSAAEERGAVAAFALIATWAIMGLWHGAAWTFVIWGLWHGGVILLARGVVAVASSLPLMRHLRFLAWPVTLCAIMLGWVWFRAPDVGYAWTMVSTVFTPSAYLNIAAYQAGGGIWSLLPLTIDPNAYLALVLAFLAMTVAFALQRSTLCAPVRRIAENTTLRWASDAVLVALAFVFLGESAQFIYFQF